MRNVECKSADGGLSAKCDPLTKPSSVQQCTTGIACDPSSSGVGGGTIIVGSSGPRVSLNVNIRLTTKHIIINRITKSFGERE